MSPLRVMVITAGLSQPSSTRLLADRLATATGEALERFGRGTDIEVVELREHARDLTNLLLTGVPSPALAAVLAHVQAADGLVAVSPIFSASYNGLFKMFFDVLEPDALAGKPTLIAATAGTARHSLALEHALRPLFSYLRAVVVPTAVFAASEDWASDGDLTARIERGAAELASLVSQSPARAARPHNEVVPFERLLAGLFASGHPAP